MIAPDRLRENRLARDPAADNAAREQGEPFPEARLYVHLVEGVGPPG
jgi:hypothetical protein